MRSTPAARTGRVGNEAEQVRGVAGRREGAGHSEEDDQSSAEHEVGGGVDGVPCPDELDGDRGHPVWSAIVMDGWLTKFKPPELQAQRTINQSPVAVDPAEIPAAPP